MLAWMVYVVLVTALLAAAALAAETAAQIRGAATRWPWIAGIVASLVLPAVISSASIQIPRLSIGAGLLAAPPFPLRALTAAVLRPSAWLDASMGPIGRIAGLETVLLFAWATVSAVIFAAILINSALVHRRKRAWDRQVIAGTPVFVSEDVGPAVVGLLHPQIVVPRWIAETPPATQALVLAHERSHLEARDAQLLALAILLIAAMPWNLPLWWQLRRLRFAIEVDCDRRVLKTGHDRRSYGETLIMVGERQSRRIAVVAAMSESKSFLEQRISKMMIKQKKHAWAAAVGLSGLAFVLAAGAAEVGPPNAAPTVQAAASASSAAAPVAYREAKVAFRLADDVARPGDQRVLGPDGRELWLASAAGIDRSVFASATSTTDAAGHPSVDFVLTPAGQARVAAVTRANVGRRMALLVDGKVLWAPRIRAEITGGAGRINGRFTREEADALARTLAP
jgi:hypothetical protein